VVKENLLKIVNKYFKDRVLKYNGPIIHGVEMNADIDFKVEVLKSKKMISVGEWYDYLSLKITIVEVNNDISRLILGLIPNLENFGEKELWYFKQHLGSYLYDTFKFFDTDVRITIDELVLDVSDNKQLTESKMSRIAIRTVVKDIIKIIKDNEEGEFNLPIDGDEYSFTNSPVDFRVELYLVQNNDIKNFNTEAYSVSSVDIIEIGVEYNPNLIEKQLYDLVGELNDIVAHEIEHILQSHRGEYEIDDDIEEIKDPLKYYTQSHEISAQIKGFKRLSKLRKKPFEEVVLNWFDTHSDIHTLNEKDKNTVIKTIISTYNSSK